MKRKEIIKAINREIAEYEQESHAEGFDLGWAGGAIQAYYHVLGLLESEE